MTRRSLFNLLLSLRTRADWEKQVIATRAAMQEVMGPLPARRSSPPSVTVLDEVSSGSYVRRKIAYSPEDGDAVPAYILLPSRRTRRAPALLCLHQTTKIGKDEPAGLGGKPNLHYAREVAERGYIAFVPDYPNFGDYRFDAYEHGYASATMKGIYNHIRAVDLLASMQEVDARRIGVIGHSLGGHNALFLSAFDDRIDAVVSSCGFTSFAKYYGGDLTGWTHRGYMPRIASVYEKSAAQMPFDFSGVLIALAPRSVFINAPKHDANFEVSGVDDCVQAARRVYEEVFRSGNNLVVVHPDCAHDFPPEVREQAYRFLNQWSGR